MTKLRIIQIFVRLYIYNELIFINHQKYIENLIFLE